MLTVLAVSLLMVIALTFVSLVRMELRAVRNHLQLTEARGQALMAMELAIGRLQETAGADQRVTGTAALAGGSQHPQWTGVWSTISTNQPVWLVSGTNVSPSVALDAADSVLLVGKGPSQGSEWDVRAALVREVVAQRERQYAWWVGDEGVKARVDLRHDPTAPVNLAERYARAQLVQEPDLVSLGAPWDQGESATPPPDSNFSKFRLGGVNRELLLNLPTVGLAADDLLPREVFADLTTQGYGLPVNVIDGGLKADFSVIMDRSMEGSGLVEHYMGATPVNALSPGSYGADVWTFPDAQIYNPERFFLSSRMGTEVVNPGRAGPNMGILWHYGRLWQSVNANNEIPVVGVYPRVQSPLRQEAWLPYTNAGSSGNEMDRQHTNSGVMPVLAHLQLGMRLRSRFDAGQSNYVVQVELKPVLGLWNPYNVKISSERYLVDWMAPPMVKLRIQEPTGPEYEHNGWLRLVWSVQAGNGDYPTTSQPGGGRWMQLRAENYDFEPGEVRLFSVLANDARESGTTPTMDLVPGWNTLGAFVVDMPKQNNPTGSSRTILRVPPGTLITVDDVYFQDSHHPDTQAQFPNFNPSASLSWLTFKAQGGSLYMTRYTGMWNSSTIKRAALDNEVTVPERIMGNLAARTPVTVESLLPGGSQYPYHVGTWAFHLRTTTQMTDPKQRIRGWIDSDPRALIGASRWDGTRADLSDQQDGWYFIASLMGGRHDRPATLPSITDYSTGPGRENRGLVAMADWVTNEAPQTDGSARFRGYTGGSNTPVGGQTHVPLFDVPKGPLTSIGQFQHAQLSRYSFEPAFVLGNSYASVRIPLNQTVAERFNGISYSGLDFDLYDISYEVNQRIWDRYFFSSMAPDYVGGGNSFDTAFLHRLDRLPNPRMVYQPSAGAHSIDQLLADAGQRGAEAIAARIKVLGAFNVNSTSKTAWKAVLSSMVSSELPVVDPLTRALSWESPDGIRFNRFSHVLNPAPYESGDANSAAYWQGWRKISREELDRLAEAIVEEVKARGPFRSFADFVNRDPESPNTDHQRKGALQAALDRTVNRQGSDLPASVGGAATPPLGDHFSAAMDGESESVGFAGYLMQGDVLQSLAPILQVRSDTFRVRAYGEVRGPDGEPLGKAWCEAIVQRSHDYVDPANAAWQNPVDDSVQPLNLRFGRSYNVVSFRWLDSSDI